MTIGIFGLQGFSSSFSLHPASLRSPLDKSGSTVESRFIDLSALAGWIGADAAPGNGQE